MKLLLFSLIIIAAPVLAQQASGIGSGSQGSGHVPLDSGQPNAGTYTTPRAGLGEAAPENTGRGTDIDGAKTMGQEASPNSGMTKSQSTDVTGNDLGSATLDSSNQDPVVPSRNPTTEARKVNKDFIDPVSDESMIFEDAMAHKSTQTGPYKIGGEPEDAGKQAQESDTGAEQAVKQQGE